jgi:hypothetical protein
MARVAILAVLAALVAGCASDAAPDAEPVVPKPATSEKPVASKPVATPSELKREARELVTRLVVNDLRGTSATVTCPRVYDGYVACSATWRGATTWPAAGRARCQGDFELDRSKRPLELPHVSTSFCIQDSR